MANARSPRLFGNRNKDQTNLSAEISSNGIPGRCSGKRIDARKSINSISKNIEVTGTLRTFRSGDPHAVGSSPGSKSARSKALLRTSSSQETRYRQACAGQTSHLVSAQVKDADKLVAPAPETAKSNERADTGSGDGYGSIPDCLVESTSKITHVLQPRSPNCDYENNCQSLETASAVASSESINTGSYNNSADVDESSGATSRNCDEGTSFDQDLLDSRPAEDSVDKSVIVDYSDTSTTVTERVDDDFGKSSKDNQPLKSTVVWREGLVPRWKGLKNGEVDALLLLSSCVDWHQTSNMPYFPSANREHGPLSPGSDSSTSSHASFLKSIHPCHSYYKPCRTWSKTVTSAYQIPEGSSDFSLKSHNVKDNADSVKADPSGCISFHKSSSDESFPETKAGRSVHDVAYYGASVPHNTSSPQQVPPFSRNFRRNMISKRFDSRYAHANSYKQMRSAILQNYLHCDLDHSVICSRCATSGAESHQAIQAQFSQCQEHQASPSQLVRSSVWTNTEVRDGQVCRDPRSEFSKTCCIPHTQEQSLRPRFPSITKMMEHYKSRNSAISSSQKACLDERWESQGIRDVHVVGSPQVEVRCNPSSAAGSPTEAIEIPKTSSGFPELLNIEVQDKHEKAVRDLLHVSPRHLMDFFSETNTNPLCNDSPKKNADFNSLLSEADSYKKINSELNQVADPEELSCRYLKPSPTEVAEGKALGINSIIKLNFESSPAHLIAAATAASAGLLVVGVIGYVYHRRSRRSWKLKMNICQ